MRVIEMTPRNILIAIRAFASSFLCVTIQRYMEDENIRLRPMRIFDGPVMEKGLRNEDILKASGVAGPISKSWFSVWWWLKRTYVFLFCIEADSECIGFIGLYNLKTDNSAEMSLVVFDEKKRRLGYGTKAFNLLAENLKRYALKIRVRVKAYNHASISFWTKLGFEEQFNPDDIRVMSMGLKRDNLKKEQH